MSPTALRTTFGFIAACLAAASFSGCTRPRPHHHSADAAAGPAVVQEAGRSALDSTVDPHAAELSSSWSVTPCSVTTRGSTQVTQTFTADRMILAADIYSDAKCATILMRHFQVASYKTGDVIGSGPARAIDYSQYGEAFAVYGDAVAQYLNNGKYCGFSDWQAGTPKVATANECLKTTDTTFKGIGPATKTYDVYEIVGTNLLAASQEDGSADLSTPGKRPSGIPPTVKGHAKLAALDDVLAHLDVLLASQLASAPAPSPAQSKVTISVIIPTLPDRSNTLNPYLELTFTPGNPLLTPVVLDVDAQKTSLSPALYPDTYTVSAALLSDSGKSPQATGTAQVVVGPGSGQSVTLDVH